MLVEPLQLLTWARCQHAGKQHRSSERKTSRTNMKMMAKKKPRLPSPTHALHKSDLMAISGLFGTTGSLSTCLSEAATPATFQSKAV